MKPGDMVTPAGVLVMTAEQMHSDRAAWLAARDAADNVPGRYTIGSSDVPSILDLDGVDTPAHVYAKKVHKVATPTNEAMTWGHRLEAVIADEWTMRNTCVTDEIGLLARADAPWHRSTIDRRVRECPAVKGLRDGCLCEIKNVGYSSYSRWGGDLPDRILAQIIHQLYVTGYDHAHYACLVGGNMLKQGIVWAKREDKLMDYVVGAVNRFRDEHLLTGIEPEWNVMDKPAKMLELDRAMHPQRAGTIGLDEIGDVLDYAALSRQAGDIEKKLKAAKARLAQLADGAEVVLYADELAYQYATARRAKADLDRLRERWPEAYADVVTETEYPILRLASDYKIRPNRK